VDGVGAGVKKRTRVCTSTAGTMSAAPRPRPASAGAPTSDDEEPGAELDAGGSGVKCQHIGYEKTARLRKLPQEVAPRLMGTRTQPNGHGEALGRRTRGLVPLFRAPLLSAFSPPATAARTGGSFFSWPWWRAPFGSLLLVRLWTGSSGAHSRTVTRRARV